VYQVEQTHSKHGFDVAWGFCPECEALIVLRREGRYGYGEVDEPRDRELLSPYEELVLYPPGSARKVESEIPRKIRQDFLEAAAVLSVSPKASAALSRRLLQHVLREAASVKPSMLAAEIDEFTGRSGVPTHLAEALDAVRKVGNLAAHPMKNKHTGEVVEVEPGEAEWLLEALEALFDFSYVQPQRLASRKEALRGKMEEVKRR
jgi:hypothetical protein